MQQAVTIRFGTREDAEACSRVMVAEGWSAEILAEGDHWIVVADRDDGTDDAYVSARLEAITDSKRPRR
jgi:hypothetical protein